jgi:hypothetical protein
VAVVIDHQASTGARESVGVGAARLGVGSARAGLGLGLYRGLTAAWHRPVGRQRGRRRIWGTSPSTCNAAAIDINAGSTKQIGVLLTGPGQDS